MFLLNKYSSLVFSLLFLGACETPKVYQDIVNTDRLVPVGSLEIPSNRSARDYADHTGSLVFVNGFLIASSPDGEVMVVEPGSFKKRFQTKDLGGVLGPVTAFSKSPTRAEVLIPLQSGEVQLWELDQRGRLSKKWILNLRRAVDTQVTLGPNETYLIQTADETLWAVDRASGRVQWTYHRTNDAVSNSKGQSLAIVSNNRIFLGTNDGYLAEISGTDGKLVKDTRVLEPRPGIRFRDVDYIQWLEGEKILGASVESGAFVYDPKTSQVSRRLDIPMVREPTLCGDLLLTSSLRGEVVALDKTSWRERWKKKLDFSPTTRISCRGDYVIAIGTHRYLYAFDRKKGDIVLRQDLGPQGGSFVDPIVIGDHFFWISQNRYLHKWKIRG